MGAALVTFMALQMRGLMFTSASSSAFITAASVFFIPVISALFLRKFPTGDNLIGAAVSFAGIFFITGGLRSTLNYGDFLTLIGAFVVAVHIIMADYFTAKEDGLTLGVLQSFFAGLFGLIIWGFDTGFSFSGIQPTPLLMATVFLTAVVCTAFASTAQVYMQQFVPPARIGVVLLLEPVFTFIFALFIRYGGERALETLSLPRVIGAAAVVLGAAVSEFGLASKVLRGNRWRKRL